MVNQKKLFLSIFLIFASTPSVSPLAEQIAQIGYVEIHDHSYGAVIFDSLYASFDAFITFLQAHPPVAKKLFAAKERFIRSKNREYYGTDFFGFFDESQRSGRNQISFYYASQFHEFLFSGYPEFKTIPEVLNFFEQCRQIQEPCGSLFLEAAAKLGLPDIFASSNGQAPVLLKVIKYLPSYQPTKPHYDGTAFSLFLDSTDNESLLLSPYKTTLIRDDFCCVIKAYENSLLLIPGALLSEFLMFPTPHIVMGSGKERYAVVAFAMRPNHCSDSSAFSALPTFNH